MERAQKPSQMTRRVFIALSGSAAAVTAVAIRSPSAPAQTPPAAAPTKGVELKFAMVAGYKADGTRSILPKFEQASGIKVVQDDLPYAPLHEKGLKAPDTWQEVMETAKKLTDPGKEIWGWAERGKRDVQVAAFMLILQ